MTVTAPVNALLFDLGRVIIDINPARVFAHWARCAKTDTASLSGRFEIDEAYRANERGETDMDTFFAHLRKKLGLEHIGEEDLRNGWNQTFVGPVAGIEKLLGNFQGKLPIHALSNTNAAHSQYMRDHMGALLARFDAVHLSQEIGARKPEPEAYLRVIKRIGEPAGNILFFDDLRENIEAARRVGLQAVWVRDIRDTQDALTRLGR